MSMSTPPACTDESVESCPPSVEAILKHFGDLDLDLPHSISQPFGFLAVATARRAPNDPETEVALRKLLEAQDCAVRASIAVAVNPSALLSVAVRVPAPAPFCDPGRQTMKPERVQLAPEIGSKG